MFKPGDKVTVTNTQDLPDKVIGRTGTVTLANPGDNLVAVAGLENPVKEWLLGELGCRPDQLKLAE